MSDKQAPRCLAVIYKRDTYRVDRSTKSGFSMHYAREQCSRKAKAGKLCAQHAKIPGGVMTWDN